MTISITDPADNDYLVPGAPCGRGPHSTDPETRRCLPGPKCNGCLDNGIRLRLEQATPAANLTAR
jgi:hypothetical protein